MRRATLLIALLAAAEASGDLYSYVNESGDYVVSQKRPEASVEYAVLSDEGEFIRLVPAPQANVPITHWRPWYLPRERDPLDGPEPNWKDAEPQVEISEIEGSEEANGRR